MIEGFDFESGLGQDAICFSTEGGEGSGKSHLALSEGVPEPVFLQNLDQAAGAPLKKAREAGKEVALATYEYSVKVAGLKKGKEYHEAMEKANAEAEGFRKGVWGRFKEEYRRALASGFRTIVWDKATEVYALLRLAHFGHTFF